MTSNAWILSKILSVTLVGTILGCDTTEFKGQSADGQSSNSQSPTPTPINIDSIDTNNIPGQSNAEAQISETFDLAINARSEPIDIAFLVDTSGSMSQEKRRLERNMEGFIDRFLTKQDNLDYQLFLVGKDFQFPKGINNNPRVDVVNARIGSSNALDVAVKLLNNNLLGQSLTTRTNGRMELIVISDDNAKGRSIARINNTIAQGSLRLNAIIGINAVGNGPECRIASVGKAYINLARKSTTPGLVQDLCDDDWKKLLTKLGGAIASRTQATVKLSSKFDRTKQITVSLNGNSLSPNQYDLDTNSNMIALQSSLLNDRSNQVIVTYTPVATDKAPDSLRSLDKDLRTK